MIRLSIHPRGFAMTHRISHLREAVATTHQIPHLKEDVKTIHRIFHQKDKVATTHQISHLKDELAMTPQISRLRETEQRTKTDDTTPHRFPLQERVTRAPLPEFRGSTIKTPHIEKGQKLSLQVTFHLPGDEPKQAKAQTRTSPLHAGVPIGDRMQALICLHLEREARLVEIQIRISPLPGRSHREAVDLIQTCPHHEGHAHLIDRQALECYLVALLG